LKIRFDNQFWRMNCQTFSWPLSSGVRGGNSRSEILLGTLRALALWRLGSIYRTGFNLGAAIRPELRRLAEATGETASFYICEGRSRVCLFRHNSPQSARHHLDEGTELPLSAGASAHVLMAYTEGKGSKARAVQQRGHCVSVGERDPQVAAIAVPVFDLVGQFRGALAISGLIGRFKKARQSALAGLTASAHRLRTMLPASD
jgi:DNA-binding IclR family transcriptional regulator